MNIPKPFFAFLLLSFLACKNNPKSSTKGNEDIKNVELQLKGYYDGITPQTTIVFTLDKRVEKIIEKRNCIGIKEKDFEKYEIPTTANVACTCWWAGAGVNYYALASGEEIQIYEQQLEEEMEDDPVWILRGNIIEE